MLSFLASIFSVVLQALRLRVKAAQTESDMEDARDDAAARIRDALAHGRITDAGAARADHDALNETLAGMRPAGRKTGSPKK